MSSYGIDRFTGAAITGWASVLQSVDVIFETEIGEEIMLEQFGGGLRRLLGRRLTPGILALASSIFALDESRFGSRACAWSASGSRRPSRCPGRRRHLRDGGGLSAKGHLGDLNEEPTLRLIGVAANDNGNAALEDFNEAAA